MYKGRWDDGLKLAELPGCGSCEARISRLQAREVQSHSDYYSFALPIPNFGENGIGASWDRITDMFQGKKPLKMKDVDVLAGYFDKAKKEAKANNEELDKESRPHEEVEFKHPEDESKNIITFGDLSAKMLRISRLVGLDFVVFQIFSYFFLESFAFYLIFWINQDF